MQQGEDRETSLVFAHPIALHRAAGNGRIDDMREAILSEDVNVLDDKGEAALHHAVRHGNLNCVELLLDGGADVNLCTRGPLGMLQTPLHIAAGKACGQRSLRDSLAIVQTLLDHGANPGALNKMSKNPFHIAVMSGAAELCGAMLDSLAPENQSQLISAPADGDSLPVHLAALANDGLMLQWLLNRGADPLARDRRGRTPADIALSAGSSQVSWTRLVLQRYHVRASAVECAPSLVP